MYRRHVVTALALLLAPGPLVAQVPLDRPPNLTGTWVPDPWVVRFDFIHRFWVTPSPSNSVINYPTFTFALGFPSRLALGMHYATRSEIPGRNNETEVYGRWQVGSPAGPLRLALTPAYNTTAGSLDGELGVDWTTGRLTLSGALRGMSNAYAADRVRGALAGGVTLRLNDYVAIGGDLASLFDPESDEDPAWSAGLLFVIPGSPHTFSLHASNVAVNTIQGSSRGSIPVAGATDKPLFGFEFTIPLHLKRFGPWFGKGGKAGGAAAVGAATPSGQNAVAEVRMAQFRFTPDSVVIAVGQAIRWVNADPVEHTVTFAASGPAGSGTMPANGSFVARFDQPGTYRYTCTPHPYMKGVVVVQ